MFLSPTWNYYRESYGPVGHALRSSYVSKLQVCSQPSSPWHIMVWPTSSGSVNNQLEHYDIELDTPSLWNGLFFMKQER